MRPRLCFRFDVDTHRCLGPGTRALTDVADRLGVRFTFFVNMGRATRPIRALKEAIRRPGGRQAVDGTRIIELSPVRRLGLRGCARLIVTNPEVGASDPEEIRRIADAGHEIGLHGGRNHRDWQEEGGSWTVERAHDEIRWGLARLDESGAPRPAGFASPAWSSSTNIGSAAADLGFTYLADVHDPEMEGRAEGGPIATVVTNVVGEPGGVGWIEWMRARGAPDDAIVADLRRRLARIDRLAVLYDHPVWAGLHDIELVERLVETGLEEGFEVVTLADALGAHEPPT